VPSHPAFDPSAVAAAARRFADQLAVHPGGRAVQRIEVTLTGRGPIERLFALEAALLDAWPDTAPRPAHDLVSSTGELGPSAALTLRAFGRDGAEVLRRNFDLDAAPLKRASAATHG
jgi:hypothetical protein